MTLFICILMGITASLTVLRVVRVLRSVSQLSDNLPLPSQTTGTYSERLSSTTHA